MAIYQYQYILNIQSVLVYTLKKCIAIYLQKRRKTFSSINSQPFNKNILVKHSNLLNAKPSADFGRETFLAHPNCTRTGEGCKHPTWRGRLDGKEDIAWVCVAPSQDAIVAKVYGLGWDSLTQNVIIMEKGNWNPGKYCNYASITQPFAWWRFSKTRRFFDGWCTPNKSP